MDHTLAAIIAWSVVALAACSVLRIAIDVFRNKL